MLVCKELTELRAQISALRCNDDTQGRSIAFVPTMGNLHAGHLSLVDIAQKKASFVVVSIYVNPLQFSPDEDFSSYPRTLKDDLEKLKHMGVDLVFTPDSSLIYPQGESQSCFAEVPHLSNIIEGEYRPGFFRGVATVVLKLFNMVQPDIAVFGEKDFQQLLIIKQMVNDLHLPIEIIGGETKREADGLAMSSRNNYLDTAERENSRFLSETLSSCRRQIEQGVDIKEAEAKGVKSLSDHGFVVDYVTLRETSALKEVKSRKLSTVGEYLNDNKEVILLAAARMGKTRLIDNLKFVY